MTKVVARDGKIFNSFKGYCWACRRVVKIHPDKESLEWGNAYPSFSCKSLLFVSHGFHFHSRPWTKDGRGVLDDCPHEEPELVIYEPKGEGAYAGSTVVCKQCLAPVPKIEGELEVSSIDIGETYKIMKNRIKVISKNATLISKRFNCSPTGWQHYDLEWSNKRAPTYVTVTLEIERQTYQFFRLED